MLLKTEKHFVVITIEVEMFMYSCSLVTVDVIMERNVRFKGNEQKQLAGNRRMRKHMKTIHRNKSNTTSSTFNMKHISELVDVFHRK